MKKEVNIITVTVLTPYVNAIDRTLSTAHYSHNFDIVLASEENESNLLRTVRCQYCISGLEGIPSHDCTLQK